MDPNATLQRMRELRRQILAADSDERADILASLAAELAECFDAIDNWLASGGFLPRAWER